MEKGGGGAPFKAYVKNGYHQVAEAIITYGEYDPDKMKPIITTGVNV